MLPQTVRDNNTPRCLGVRVEALVASLFVPSHSIAFTVGAEDARAGGICCPEMWFTHPDDLRDYAAGYASVNGHTLTTLQLLADDVRVMLPTSNGF